MEDKNDSFTYMGLCFKPLFIRHTFYQHPAALHQTVCYNFVMLYTHFVCVFKYDLKFCEFPPILSDIPKIVVHQENTRKMHVTCEHTNLILYVVRKHAAICRHILWSEGLLEAFTVQLFLQHCYERMLPFVYSLHCKTCDGNVSAALQKNALCEWSLRHLSETR